MATSPAGNPYVESSDLVANYPATSLALANRLDKYAVNPFADATARDAAIPTPVQGQLAQTLDDNKVWRYDGTAWAPFSGAVGAANFTDTATGTYSSGGINYKYLTLTGTGSVTIDKAGFADILLVGGAGSGGTWSGGGGGAGSHLEITNAYLSAATHVVTIGAGGPSATEVTDEGRDGQNGVASRVGDYYSPGGGAGGAETRTSTGARHASAGFNGGSGGGAGGGVSGAAFPGGSGITGLGNDGGTTDATRGGGGGGGSGSVGTDGASSIPGNGGAGTASSITGTSVTRCGGGGGAGISGSGSGGSGGGGGVGVNGTANTGGGGGGEVDGSTSGAGGSGIAIIRVVV